MADTEGSAPEGKGHYVIYVEFERSRDKIFCTREVAHDTYHEYQEYAQQGYDSGKQIEVGGWIDFENTQPFKTIFRCEYVIQLSMYKAKDEDT